MPPETHILGMSLPFFTNFHVGLSIIAIASGLVAVRGMLAARVFRLVTMLFLSTTLLTSLTGFLFPFHGVTPGIIIGILTVILMFAAIFALYSRHLAGPWRWIYAVCSVTALWFNVFIFIVQIFEKIPLFHSLAPTGTELPFKLFQMIVVITFILLGRTAVKRFHPAPPPAA